MCLWDGTFYRADCKKNCRKLITADYSDGMLRQTRKKLQQFPNVKLHGFSIMDIPYRDNSFDVVAAANVIHLLDDPDSAVKGLPRVCKRGGKVIIPTYVNEQKRNAMWAARILEKIGDEFKRQYSLDSYKNFFEKSGCANVQYKLIDGHMPCMFAIIVKS